MSPSVDHAKAIADYVLADYENERATTKRVIAAIPAGGENYTPDAKSMTALNLAVAYRQHRAVLFERHLRRPVQPRRGLARPDHIRTAQDVLAWYDENVPPALERARGLSGHDLSKVVDFFGKFQLPAVSYLNVMVKHSAHHRGQLSTYLRPMGAKSGIYTAPALDNAVRARSETTVPVGRRIACPTKTARSGAGRWAIPPASRACARFFVWLQLETVIHGQALSKGARIISHWKGLSCSSTWGGLSVG